MIISRSVQFTFISARLAYITSSCQTRQTSGESNQPHVVEVVVATRTDEESLANITPFIIKKPIDFTVQKHKRWKAAHPNK